MAHPSHYQFQYNTSGNIKGWQVIVRGYCSHQHGDSARRVEQVVKTNVEIGFN